MAKSNQLVQKSGHRRYDIAELLEIITVFSARLYGSRSHKNKKIVEELREVALKL